jgi:type IV secretory pathway VirB10-like protein
MQFQIPQFIETESKIIGPMTLKQFAYIGVTGLIIFLLFFILKTAVWAFLSAIIAAIGLGLAFIKYNGQKLPTILRSAIVYIWRPKFYLWMSPKGEAKKGDEIKTLEVTKPETAEPAPKLPAPAPAMKDIAIPEKTSAPAPEPATQKVETQKQVEVAPTKKEIVAKALPAEDNKEKLARDRKQAFVLAKEEEEKAKGPTKLRDGLRGLKNLWLKLSTTTKTLSKREKQPPAGGVATSGPKSKEIFELFRKITGERETARRVDYR